MIKFVCNSYASLGYHSLIFCFCDVMVSVLDFIVVDLVRSTQFTNKMCICCFFTKHAAFRNKDMLTQTQVNMSWVVQHFCSFLWTVVSKQISSSSHLKVTCSSNNDLPWGNFLLFPEIIFPLQNPSAKILFLQEIYIVISIFIRSKAAMFFIMINFKRLFFQT